MSKTILVTGAAGFIGSHTVQALLRRGDRVVGLDNFNAYYDPVRKRQNVEEVQATAEGRERFVMVEGDIRDQALLARLFAEHGFAGVVHLAAMAGVRASMDAPALYIDVNLVGTLKLLEEVRKRAVGNFVFASTSSVYGATGRIPFVEEDACDRPLAPYPASKRAAEMLGYSYHHLYGVNFTALRFFTVYGPRGRPDMMAYKVLNNIHFGQDVPLYNRGEMHRDWTYVSDIVQGIVAAIDRPLGYEIVNLGRGEPVRLADFVEQVQRLAGKAAQLRDEAMPAADVPYTYADLSKARRLLGYQPSVSVETGVAEFYKWYRAAVLSLSTISSVGG
jgi:UDP-glucuronate 4-epimerase